MHGPDPPMPAVEAQDVVRIRLPRAGDGIRCFGFGFDTVPGPDVPALTLDVGNGANRGPWGAHVFAGSICGQQGDATQVNPPMPCFGALSGVGPAIQRGGKNRLPKSRFNLLPKVFPVILHRKKAVTALDTAIVECIQEQGAGFRSLAEDIDTTAPASRLIFYVMAAPRKRPRRNGGTEWTTLPAACSLPPGTPPGVRK